MKHCGHFPSPTARLKEYVARQRASLKLQPSNHQFYSTRPQDIHTSYILNKPELTLPQLGTPAAMEWSWEECSWKGPYLTSWIRVTAMKYRFVDGRGSRRIAETGISVWSIVEISEKSVKSDRRRRNHLGVVHFRKCREENSNHPVPRLRDCPQVRVYTRLEVSNIISDNVWRQSRRDRALLLRQAGRTWPESNREETGRKRFHDQFRSPFEKTTQTMSAGTVLCGVWLSRIQVPKAVPKFDPIAAQNYHLIEVPV